jgi:NMD protein affecting ribosome stability and mRNA decay
MTPKREPCPVCGRSIEPTVVDLCRRCWASYDKWWHRPRGLNSLVSSMAWAVRRAKRVGGAK